MSLGDVRAQLADHVSGATVITHGFQASLEAVPVGQNGGRPHQVTVQVRDDGVPAKARIQFESITIGSRARRHERQF